MGFILRLRMKVERGYFFKDRLLIMLIYMSGYVEYYDVLGYLKCVFSFFFLVGKIEKFKKKIWVK